MTMMDHPNCSWSRLIPICNPEPRCASIPRVSSFQPHWGGTEMAKNTIIRFKNVTKQYDDDPPVLTDVSFELERGKFYTLLGPSGCGKRRSSA